MMNFAFPWRRAALVVLCALPLLLLFEAYSVYADKVSRNSDRSLECG
jgi:hypothetical protein